MSVASEITRLQTAKADLKTAINAKTDAQHQIDDETIDDYASFVNTIQTGGNLQTKSTTITTNTTTLIEPDAGYDGLESVSVTTNVSGGTTPSKGVLFTAWDSSGYPTEMQIIGITSIPASFCRSIANTSLVAHLQNVIFENTTTSIGDNAFYECANLSITSLPSALTSIGGSAFRGCSNLKIDFIPNNVTSIAANTFYNCTSMPNINTNNVQSIATYAFYGCTSLKKALLPYVAALWASSASTSLFRACTGLKQVWIGSSVAAIDRYVFFSCSALEKIYINLPRATVETFSGYQYAFKNDTSQTSIIVCNDDSGFISQSDFEALVI